MLVLVSRKNKRAGRAEKHTYMKDLLNLASVELDLRINLLVLVKQPAQLFDLKSVVFIQVGFLHIISIQVSINCTATAKVKGTREGTLNRSVILVIMASWAMVAQSPSA